MRVAPLLTAGLGLTGLLAGGVPASATPAAPAAPAHQRLVWGPCSPQQQELNEAGAQCAKVTVPLDYSDPGGPTIEIAISRIKAGAKHGKRRGVLLSDPGGPGGTGLANTLYLRPALKDVADRYDLIGFDPRFLGESTPIACDPDAPTPAPGPATTRREDFERSVRSARDTARRCEEHGNNARLLPHATSRNVARDMDAIRAALGERRLSYYGVSYGADLGAVYTQMFPRRADRIVIDSSTDPTATQYELFQRAGRPLEEALDAWAGWTARHDGTYRLGRTPAQVRSNVQQLLDGAEQRPVTVSGVRLDAQLLRLVLRQLIQHEEYDPALAGTVRALTDAAAGRPVEPRPELAAMLELLASPELADSMLGGALFMCGDNGWPAGGWPKSPETYWKNMEHSRATQPVFGPLVNSMMAPCAFWTSTSREPATAIGNDVPVLMLQARRDNNVPYEGALALHHRLTGSRLVTADIRSHGVYGRGLDGLTPVPCADEAVDDYLRDGTLPGADLTCPRTGEDR
ncbi:alpha/beta hydrolase [Streptomyces sp. NBC_01363]|uniref:alpha/beta hydrolase n=1 Tax=Streptomyces sp. NBC_01363 TaxID=2903840 RepID=UPI00225723AF|nr:alpha/beta hydrolase [Streptomyces sp. NBC_01363]MCX4732025.1 alpha/beta hydrolase [Streptomyces sp. NBC_01363]